MFYKKQLIKDLQLQLLSNDDTLTWIDLSNDNIDNDDIALIANGLRKNTTLKALSVPENNISDEGMQNLAKCLCDNTTLTHLDLRHNNIGKDGIQAMAECLCVNDTLQFINLEENGVDNNGIKALSNALLVNDTVKWLDLTDKQGGIALQKRWKRHSNQSLCVNELSGRLKERIIYILLILKNSILDPILIAMIMLMLRPKDILNMSDSL